MNFNLNGQMWPVATILDSTALDNLHKTSVSTDTTNLRINIMIGKNDTNWPYRLSQNP